MVLGFNETLRSIYVHRRCLYAYEGTTVADYMVNGEFLFIYHYENFHKFLREKDEVGLRACRGCERVSWVKNATYLMNQNYNGRTWRCTRCELMENLNDHETPAIAEEL